MITEQEIYCATCGKRVHRTPRELKKAKRRNQIKFYCNRFCVGDSGVRHKRRSFSKNNEESHNRRDEFTPFRYHFGKAKQRATKYHRDFNIDLQYLKTLWENQNGKCAVTGLSLKEKFYYSFELQKKNPYQASLDRIDNSKGYIKGNVRFVCLMFNIARNDFEDKEVLEFCKRVAVHHE